MAINTTELTTSMFSCFEQYSAEIVDSMEFSLDRELTPEERSKVYQILQYSIGKMTTELESSRFIDGIATGE